MSRYAKALVAVCGAVLATVLIQFPDSNAVQTWGPIVTTLLTAVGVYVVPNAAPADPPPDEGGQVDVAFLLVLATFILVLLMFLGLRVFA